MIDFDSISNTKLRKIAGNASHPQQQEAKKELEWRLSPQGKSSRHLREMLDIKLGSDEGSMDAIEQFGGHEND